jgi:hypothetical protein
LGSAETTMAVSSTTVLAQMARFLIFLSDVPSYWFSLNKSCDDEFHLAKQFGMDKENFEALLIAGNLAQYSHSAFWQISGHHSWVGITSQTCPLIPPHLNLNERKFE